jgi:hypothetical protein
VEEHSRKNEGTVNERQKRAGPPAGEPYRKHADDQIGQQERGLALGLPRDDWELKAPDEYVQSAQADHGGKAYRTVDASHSSQAQHGRSKQPKEPAKHNDWKERAT